MKLSCLIHSLDGGGAERVMAGLASRLAERGHEVTLITLDDASRDRHAVSPGVTRQPLDVMGHSRNLWQRLVATRRRVRTIATAIDAAAPDVVLSFCDSTNLLVLTALRGWPLANSPRLPLVIAERTDPSQQSLGSVGEFARRRLYPQANVVVALTVPSADHLRRLGCRHVEVIPSAVDRPPIRSDRQVAAAARRVIAAGRLEWEKGFDRLIKAFAEVAPQAQEWTLEILGEGSRRGELEAQVAALSLSGRISLPGWVQPIWEPLARSTLFVLPSRYEGFPSALLEAMAVGLPCVAVDCQSGPRAILDDSSGWLVENSVSGLTAGLRQMIFDQAARERLAAAAPAAITRFGWEAMVERYEEVLSEAIEAERQRQAGHPR